MRLAVFSDIHGNMRTWNRFLERVRGLDVDELAFCGDLIGGRNWPRILMDLASFPRVLWVLGNNDHYYLDSMCSQVPALCDRLRSLRTFVREQREGLILELMHGSPENRLYGQLYPEDLPHYHYEGEAHVVLAGHTHCRMSGYSGSTLFLNPGSLGQPRDQYPPGFALLDLPERAVTFVDVD